MKSIAVFLLLLSLVCYLPAATAAESRPVAPPLHLVARISLGAVSGRIDHLSIDRARKRLFVAELGNNTVSVIDLDQRVVVKRLTGMKAPQGVLYAPDSDRLFVASGDDGSVTAFTGGELMPVGKHDLKDDADNLRMGADQKIWVGYGGGGLAAIDPPSLAKQADIPLKGHPEGFQLDPIRNRAYVNVPDNREIAVVDLSAQRQIASWRVDARANYPMALAEDGKRVLVAFRLPARMAMFDAASGTKLADVTACGDADDVFADEKRQRVYVACGAGVVEVFARTSTSLDPIARVATSSGARTAFFDAVGDKLYVAVRAALTHPAEIWEFEPK